MLGGVALVATQRSTSDVDPDAPLALAVAGMPLGSPGMEASAQTAAYNVFAFR